MRYKRRNFLVNPRFQLRFAFFISSWVIGLSMMFPLMLNEAFSIIAKLLIQDPHGPEVEQILSAKQDILRYLLISEAVFVLVVFLLGIFLAHRIAGPLYKLNQYFREAARTGRLKPGLKFRTGDHFQELAEGYNAMVAAVQGEAPSASEKAKTEERPQS